MVISKKSKIIYFIIFIIPALLLYTVFFINPLIQGVQYSFTDWNGIVPEIPLNIEKVKYDEVIIKLGSRKADVDYLNNYYTQNEDVYNLKSWIVENDKERQLNDKERSRIKAILKSVGITPIKFIGLDNYKEMFKKDERFVPRIQPIFLFKEYDNLPMTLRKVDFEKYLIPNIKDNGEKSFVTGNYTLKDSNFPLCIVKDQFDKKMSKVKDNEEAKYILSYYTEEGNYYYLKKALDVDGVSKAITSEELEKVKTSLKKAGIGIESKYYVANENISDSDKEKLKVILAKNMFRKDFMPGVIGFTLFFTFFNVIFANLFALGLALILDNKMKTTNALRSIFFLPNVLSLIIVAFVWSFVFRLILPPLTGIDVWLGDTNIAPFAVVIVSVWQNCGYLMIIYLAGLSTIPTEILEVAELDGANYFQRFKNITLPLMIPSITICSFYSLANSLKSFDVIFALTSGGPGYSTTPIVLDIYFNAFNLNRFGYGTAKAVFLCMIIMLITGIQLYIMKKKEVEM